MNKYPDYVPFEFAFVYQHIISDEDMKEIAHEMIFNEKMIDIWNPLSQRALQQRCTEWFYMCLVAAISSCVRGPTEWDLLTPKSKEKRVREISLLCTKLSNALKGTPFDTRITNYIDDYSSLSSFILSDEEIGGISKIIIERNLIEDGECTRANKRIDVSNFWTAIGINGDLFSDVLDRIGVEAESKDFESIIKRKTDVKKVFFVRRLSSFFYKNTGMNLYNITAVISSIFLNEEITQEQVISIIK